MTFKMNRQDKVFIGTIVLVHLVYFLLACRFTRIYMGDSFEYIYEALNIKDRFFFYSGNPSLPISPEYMTQRQPGYPLFLLMVYIFTVNNWIVIALQNLLSIFNIYYCRKILSNVGYAKKYDWLLLLLLVAYPAQFINANTIAPDILLQTFTLLYLGYFLQLWHTRSIHSAGYMSIILIAGMMVKPVLYPFALVHIVLVTALFIYWKAKLQRPLLVAALPLCAVLLYNYSNYTRTGKFHFSSNQSFNAIFYFYSYTSAKNGADSADHFLRKERAAISSIPEYKERYDYANDRGKQLLADNFVPYMWFHLRNSARIFVEPGKAEMDLFTGSLTYGGLHDKTQTGFYTTLKTRGISGISGYADRNPSFLFAVLVFLFNCIRTGGLLLFLVNKRIDIPLRIFIFILLAYFAVAAGPIANTRYFLPVSLIAIGCAGTGYITLLQKKETSA